MKNGNESFFEIDDPKTLSFDISDESAYLKKLLIKLHEIELQRPEKNYAAIFYERYVQKLGPETISKMHNISKDELNGRLMEIVKFVNKEN